ncbi:MAG: TetR family transcriptional regulator [Sphingomonadales bacterium]|nr:TetR family transcriptional regulator [Sphingomonadales bacterium]
MGRPKAIDADLTREGIIDAAIRILNEEGLDALSLARIANALNVKTPALYWYFKSKAELYTYVADALFRGVLKGIDPSLTGRDLLWTFGLASRANQRTTRDAAKLISIAGVSEEIRTELVPALLDRIAKEMTPIQARKALTAIQALTLGWSVFEANPATSEVMRRSNDDGDAAYREALSHLVYGEIHREP